MINKNKASNSQIKDRLKRPKDIVILHIRKYNKYMIIQHVKMYHPDFL